MEFSELFIFASFRIVRFLKFGFFLKTLEFSNSQKFCKKSLEICSGQKSLFWVKNPVFDAKTGVSEYSKLTKISEFVLFQIF